MTRGALTIDVIPVCCRSFSGNLRALVTFPNDICSMDVRKIKMVCSFLGLARNVYLSQRKDRHLYSYSESFKANYMTHHKYVQNQEDYNPIILLANSRCPLSLIELVIFAKTALNLKNCQIYN